ncbi:hypothetical protein CDAR_36581 [Caerostris darwini]|uniref:Uncharacterized protein n=1 Tax=Caerostris darwini TaxID=1538125 RepID=A0AAV4UVG0_9ARAC|nr:hypothetical protein CDAR_36581 [Caerostris darwini]
MQLSRTGLTFPLLLNYSHCFALITEKSDRVLEERKLTARQLFSHFWPGRLLSPPRIPGVFIFHRFPCPPAHCLCRNNASLPALTPVPAASGRLNETKASLPVGPNITNDLVDMLRRLILRDFGLNCFCVMDGMMGLHINA